MLKICSIIRAALCLITLVFEILPFGAVISYGVLSETGEVSTVFITHSYFSVSLIGYFCVNYGFAAMFTVVALIVCALAIKMPTQHYTSATTFLSIATVMQAVPFIFGMPFNTITVITALFELSALIASIIISVYCYKNNEE